ncbi:MAG: dihydroneopterin aldolase [Duodenibacillus sp.]|nr:dihydroneopterin aldolase [Duodenibacillus sp.]
MNAPASNACAPECAFARLRLRCRKLSLEDYRVQAFIGVYEAEHAARQPVSVSVDAWIPYEHSSGGFEDVYDYGALPAAVDAVLARGHVELQETLVDGIAELLLADRRVAAVRVASKKLQAYERAAAAGVEIFRLQTP